MPYKNPADKAARDRRYAAANREKIAAYQHEYHVTHRDDKKIYDQERYAANRTAVLAQCQEYRSKNAAAISRRNAISYAANPYPHRIRNGIRFLRRQHGLSPEGFASLWQSQDGCCYLCQKLLTPGRVTHIDHDHNHCPPNKSCSLCRRGLACQPCNTLIGMARDDPDLLRRIASNLEVAKSLVAERIRDESIQDSLWEAS